MKTPNDKLFILVLVLLLLNMGVVLFFFLRMDQEVRRIDEKLSNNSENTAVAESNISILAGRIRDVSDSQRMAEQAHSAVLEIKYELAGKIEALEKRLEEEGRMVSDSNAGPSSTQISSVEARRLSRQNSQMQKYIQGLNRRVSRMGQEAVLNAEDRRALDLLFIRQHVLSHEPRLAGVTDEMERAVILRDYVYQHVPLKRSGGQPECEIHINSLYQSYLQAIANPQCGHICQGIGQIYQIVCEAFGIPSRYVGMFSDDKEPYSSHAATEVWVDGQWVAMDATFNVTYRVDGKNLSYSQLRQAVEEGRGYEILTNEMKIIPGREIEDYYISLDELIRFVVLYPGRVQAWDPGYKRQMPEILPKSWDGKIARESGAGTINVNKVQSFYRALSQGVLR